MARALRHGGVLQHPLGPARERRLRRTAQAAGPEPGDPHFLDPHRRQRCSAARGLMEDAIALMAAGKVRAPRATRMPLAEARRAHELLDRGGSLGKLVLIP
ncbi:zinc-binding dehydrogenase [Variovorax sp. NFACC26]|uniref:zinc-binding dehydrogenase n=1 Tax=Variovorax sp. NFACC26 TaxID=1566275 RepID=UPI003AABDC9F